MWITHRYLGTTRHGLRCLFFLLFEDYIEAQAGFSNEVTQELERFARNMANFGAVVKPFAGDVAATRKSILDKRWSERELELLRNTPAMLMIDRDFDEFDPQNHPWVLFHFGRGNQDAAKIRSLLEKISDAVRTEVSDPFEIVRSALRESAISAASQVIQVKPGVFGISIDVESLPSQPAVAE